MGKEIKKNEDLNLHDIRHKYLDSNIRYLLAMQVRAMRDARGWSKKELAEKVGMTEAEITRLENPRGRSMTLDKMKNIAQAFDVAVLIRFVPFSISKAALSPQSFSEESEALQS